MKNVFLLQNLFIFLSVNIVCKNIVCELGLILTEDLLFILYRLYLKLFTMVKIKTSKALFTRDILANNIAIKIFF